MSIDSYNKQRSGDTEHTVWLGVEGTPDTKSTGPGEESQEPSRPTPVARIPRARPKGPRRQEVASNSKDLFSGSLKKHSFYFILNKRNDLVKLAVEKTCENATELSPRRGHWCV